MNVGVHLHAALLALRHATRHSLCNTGHSLLATDSQICVPLYTNGLSVSTLVYDTLLFLPPPILLLLPPILASVSFDDTDIDAFDDALSSLRT